MTELKPSKGLQVADWALINKLGSGGNASVWKAMGRGQVVALKLLKEEHGEKSEPLQRFRLEAELLQRLNGTPGVIPCIAASVPARSSAEDPAWIAMPIATPLEEKLQEGSTFRDLVAAVATYAETLARLHERQIYHRDIKPNNLFWFDGAWVIGDCGIASFPDKGELTPMGRKFGPLFYQAPELLGKARDAHGGPVDVYSLAKTLWKLGAAQAFPVPGTLHMNVPALRLSTWVGREADILDPILERATLHEPEERITMKEFAAELDAWLQPAPGVPTMESLERELQEIRARLEHDRQWSERQQQAEEELTHLAQRVRDNLQEIHDRYAAMGPPHGVSSDQANLMGVETFAEHADPLPAQLAWKQQVAGRFAVLGGVGAASGIVLRLTHESELILTAVHRFGGDSLWSDSRRVPCRGARQERAIGELVAGLHQTFPLVVTRIREHLRERRDNQ